MPESDSMTEEMSGMRWGAAAGLDVDDTILSVNGVRVHDGKDYATHAKGPGQLLDKFLPAGPSPLAAAAN